jgi:hypothetical protein
MRDGLKAKGERRKAKGERREAEGGRRKEEGGRKEEGRRKVQCIIEVPVTLNRHLFPL